MISTEWWLAQSVGDGVDDRPAVVRALSAMAAEDAMAERADSERLARIEDERDAKLAALRTLGIGHGHVSMLGLHLQEAAGRVEELEDQLRRAKTVRDGLAGDWQRLHTRLADAASLATRSRVAALPLDGDDLLTRDHLVAEQRREDRPLTRARARTALARIRQLDAGA
jgi:hypothetical protein